MPKMVKIMAAVVAAVGLALLAYAVLSAEPADDPQGHGGMWNGHMTYSSINIGLIILASALIAVAIAFIFLREEYEPLPPSMAPPPPPQPQVAPAADEAVGRLADIPAGERSEQRIPEDEAKREEYLILRLLTGDERAMFKAVMDAGGTALQKDLIKGTRMSNAKVSRVLDRLAKKGVITKERHGATNRIRIRFVS